MDEQLNAIRSRRALLVAAAGGAAALAANAAMPLAAAAADPNDVVLGASNAATAPTTVTNTAGGTGLIGNSHGTGYGLEGTSTGGAGTFAWSVTPPSWWDPEVDGPYTGVFGFSPAHTDPNFSGVGVWGESDDIGVVGGGWWGVYGIGAVGVYGQGTNNASPAVRANAATTTGIALQVTGKVKFSRAGRKAIGAGKSTAVVTLAGTTSTSKVFAVLANSRSGRWVRAVVPASGKFTIYLNTTLRSKAYVSWFVLD